MGIKRILKDLFYNTLTLLKICRYKTFLYCKNTKPKKIGEKIVILGNAPEADLYFKNRDKFQDYDLLTVNFFPLDVERFKEYKPKVHCLVDPRFFEQSIYESMEHAKERVPRLWSILNSIDWDMYLVIEGNRSIPISNPKIHVIRISSPRYRNDSTRFQKWCFFNNLCTPMWHNVVTVGIQFAEIFGYNNIALFGVLLDWTKYYSVNEKNQLILRQNYFYGSYGDILINDTYLRQLRSIVDTFWGFEECSKLAIEKGIAITNYTLNSFLQCFSKKDIENE